MLLLDTSFGPVDAVLGEEDLPIHIHAIIHTNVLDGRPKAIALASNIISSFQKAVQDCFDFSPKIRLKLVATTFSNASILLSNEFCDAIHAPRNELVTIFKNAYLCASDVLEGAHHIEVVFPSGSPIVWEGQVGPVAEPVVA